MTAVSIDIGTSAVKAALIDGESMAILASAKAGYRIRTINVDWVELDAEAILAAIVDAVRALPDARGAELVCFDNFSPSLVLMDGDGAALHPVLTHLDRRAKAQTQNILREFGNERFQAITGIQPFTGGASVTSLLWLMEHRPVEWGRTARAGHINTYVYKRLTGVWAIDPVNASQTGMYETLREGGWSGEILAAFGIPREALPEVLAAGTVAGGLTREFAGLMGLAAGTPVALGTNDAAAAQIGAGNGVSGDILNISGSSDMVSILTDRPRVDGRYYTRAFCLPGLWQIYVTTAGGFAVDWFREQFCRDLGAREFFDVEFEAAAGLCAESGVMGGGADGGNTGGAIDGARVNGDGASGPLPVGFTPYLAGDRQSLTPKRASFTGLTLDTTRRQMLAALLYAMHEPMRSVIDVCEAYMELGGVIKLTGGMLSPGFTGLKRRLFPKYRFEARDDCPLLGNVLLARRANNNG